MKRLLLTGVAALFLATGTAHADETKSGKWIVHIHSCSIYRASDGPATDTIEAEDPSMIRLREL
jgi:hypothetical protein